MAAQEIHRFVDDEESLVTCKQCNEMQWTPDRSKIRRSGIKETWPSQSFLFNTRVHFSLQAEAS